MRHSMKRAIAFVLSLTMVLSLPMAASASGVQDLFDVDAQVAGEGFYDSGSETDTGTDTGSDTTSKTPVFDKEEDIKEVLPSILKVVLDKTELELDAGGLSGELRADLIYDKSSVNKTYEQLISLIRFRTYYNGRLAMANEYLKLDWSPEEARAGVARCDIHPRKQGEVQVFAFFDANNNGKIDPGECKSEEITVKITELANDKNTKFYKDLTFYEGQKVDLNALIDNANTTSGEALEGKLSWSVSDDSVVMKNGSPTKTKTATVDAKGVATMKKEGSAKFFAVGKKHSFEVDVTIDKKANGNTIKSFNADPSSKKQELTITGKSAKPEATLKVIAKATTKADATVLNDYVTWTVKNPKNKTIVEVVPETANVPGKSTAANTEFKATVKGLDVGKATVTATSSTGKKVNFTVTVKAPLTSLKITNTDQVLYTGQAVKLNVEKDPAANQDKLTWKVVGAGDNKPAKDVKVNKDGVLTIGKNPSTRDGSKFKVVVSAKGSTVTGEYSFDVKKLYLQPAADGIKIKDVMPAGAARMVVPQTNTYSLADADLQNFNIVDDKGVKVENPPVSVADLLTWSSSKAKALDVDAKGSAIAKTAAKKVKVTASALIVTKTKANGDAVVASQKTAAKLVDIVMPVTSLTVKKSVLGVTPNTTGSNPKSKKVTLQVAQQLPKGCTKEFVSWSIVGDDLGATIRDTKPGNANSKGELTIPANATNGCITVQAKAENGATVTQKVYVTAKTTKVAFTEKENIVPLKANTAGKKGTISLGQQGILGCDVQKKATDTNTLLEPIVSCTVTGKGGAKVELRKDGKLVEDGKYVREGNEVWITPLRAGNVTIKVTTASGKSASYTLTINGKVEAGKTEK